MPLLKEESQKYNSSVALLLIDVINDLNFGSADELLVQAFLWQGRSPRSNAKPVEV